MKEYFYNITILAKKIILLYACCLYITPGMLSLDLGIMHLSIGRILQPIIAAMCLYKIMVISLRRPFKITLYSTKYTLCFFVLWIGYAFLSLIWVLDYYAWLRSFYFLVNGVTIIFAISLYLDTWQNIKQVLTISMIMTLIHAMIGFYEIQTCNYLFLLDTSKVGSYIRDGLPVSGMNNVNDYAMLLMTGLYSTISIYFTTQSKIKKIFSVGILCFLLVMIALTRSRGIILGLCLSLVLVGALCIHIRKKIISTCAIIVFSSIIISVFWGNLTSIIHYCTDIFTLELGKGASDFIRLNLILNGFIYLKNTMFMGTGLGNIEYYMKTFPFLDTKGIVNIHNWWMEVLVSSGIFVFVGYCVFYYFLCWRMLQLSKYSCDSHIRKLGTIMLAFLVAFTIASVSSSSLMGKDIVWQYFAIIIAIARTADITYHDTE